MEQQENILSWKGIFLFSEFRRMMITVFPQECYLSLLTFSDILRKCSLLLHL